MGRVVIHIEVLSHFLTDFQKVSTSCLGVQKNGLECFEFLMKFELSSSEAIEEDSSYEIKPIEPKNFFLQNKNWKFNLVLSWI